MTTDNEKTLRYLPRMSSQWVTEVLREKKLSQAKLAKLLHQRFGTPDDRSIINKLANGKRVLSAEEMFEISEVTGHPIPPRGIHPDWRVALAAAAKKALDEGVQPGAISALVTELVVSGTLGNLRQIAETNSEFRTFLGKIAGEVAETSDTPDDANTGSTQLSDQEQSPVEVKGSQS